MSIVKNLAETNDYNYNLLKAAEECTELSEVLIKSVTKKGTKKEPSKQSVIEEIGDVQIRLDVLKHLYGEDDVNLRIVDKLKKYENYQTERQYEGRI